VNEDDGWSGFWTESTASGSKSFIEKVKKSYGFKVKGKAILAVKDHYQLNEYVSTFGYN
jgi:hypothetical protein